MVDEEEKEEAIERYLDGESSPKLGNDYGVHHQTVLGWVREKEGEDVIRSQQQYSEKFKREVAQEYVDGRSSTELSEEYGIDSGTVVHWVRIFEGYDAVRQPPNIQSRLDEYKASSKDLEILYDYFEKGKPLRYLTNEYGLSKKSVKNIIVNFKNMDLSRFEGDNIDG